MVEAQEKELTTEEVRALIAEEKRRSDAAKLKRGANARRAAEITQRKSRVNTALLHGGSGRDEPWTFRAKPSHIKAVKDLAVRLSRPRAKVSIAALMGEAIELLLASYAERAAQEAQDGGSGSNP